MAVACLCAYHGGMSQAASCSTRRWLERSRQIFHGILDLIYPPSCLLCNQLLAESDRQICTSCENSIVQDPSETCPLCALCVGPFAATTEGCPRCRNTPFHFQSAIRLGVYRDGLQKAVLRLKNSTGENLAHALGLLWANRHCQRLKDLHIDIIIPVPLFWLRRFQRGYNQAETLARAISEKLGVPCRSRWLKRTRHTPHQTGQSLSARTENVRNAFWAPSLSIFPGKTVLLVDDVMTTGSTCNEAARALRKVGVRSVIAAVLARSEGEYFR